MPIEIKELHIRVAVDAKQNARGQPAKAAGGGVDKDGIVSECVDEVMRILQAMRER
jgi:hypothetical protein